MKKYIVFLVFLFICEFVNSQGFDNVSVSGSLSSVIEKYKVKGYKFVKYFDNGALMNGKLNGRPIEIFILSTPKSKIVYKISVYLSAHQTWENLYDDYSNIFEAFMNKYGEPDYIEAKFEYPFESGDGYEMTAVVSEKCKYYAAWIKKYQNDIMIEISEFKQVRLVYESPKNIELRTNELNEINSKIY